MSRFDDQVLKAHSDSKWRRVVLFLAMVIGFLSLGVYALAFKKTLIQIGPVEISQNHEADVVDGFGMIAGDSLISLSSSIDLRVSADGFQEKTLKLDRTKLGGIQTVELRPKLAKLRFSVAPSQQAQWLIDGALLFEGEDLDYEIPAGEYKATVISTNGVKKNHQFTIGRGGLLKKIFKFDAIEGVLEISTSPVARIMIDGQEISEAEIKLNGGTHQIELRKQGYFSIKDSVSLTSDGEVIKRDYVLKPLPLTVRLSLSPNDGLLTINGMNSNFNGASQIKTPFKNPLVIKYSKDGFVDVRQVYEPKLGDALDFSAQLEVQMARLKLLGTKDAAVKINGKIVGKLPLQIDLPTKDYVVQAEKEGFQSQTKKVSPRVKRTQVVEFNLPSLAQLKKVSAPKGYTSQFGLDFKLIEAEGKGFQMGGRRSEKGQRANEIIRNIKFTKNFYVSTTELTQKQFGKGEDLSLTNTPWIQVARFCNQVSRKENLEPFYEIEGTTIISYNQLADGYRLITEAEWEFLARKFDRKKQTLFVWGEKENVPVGAGNLADQNSQASLKMYIPGYNDSFASLAPVKSFNAQPRGIFDLIGNASEWVNDSYVLAPMNAGQVEIDPLGGPPRSAMKTVKGSSYLSASLSELRAAFRDGTSEPRQDLGFRLARYM